MPYKNKEDLPEQVNGNLPEHAKEIYLKAFNNAWDQYEDPKEHRGNESQEETAHKVAWSAVKQTLKHEMFGAYKSSICGRGNVRFLRRQNSWNFERYKKDKSRNWVEK